MNAIYRRLQKLENRCGLSPETEEHRRVREQTEAFFRRVDERMAREGLPPRERNTADWGDLSGLTLSEIIRGGRARARALALAEQKA